MLFGLVLGLFSVCIALYGFYFVFFGQYVETTDDAYVGGNMLWVIPQTSGAAMSIFTDNAQLVEEGQVLVQLDPRDALIALEEARAGLAEAVRDTAQLFVHVEVLEARLQEAVSYWERALLDYEHRRVLVEDLSVSREDFEHSETDLLASAFRVRALEKELEEALFATMGTSVEMHPRVDLAKAHLRRAFLDVHRCQVRAGFHGIVAQRKVQVGEWVTSKDQLLAIVPLDEVWVEANMLEVSLKNVRVGQPVRLKSDMYGGDVTFHGVVEGIYPGSGSVFSLIPPQNATGNWIKIVQRVTVKVSLKKEEILRHPLMLGLSMHVTIDTHDRSGKRLPCIANRDALYHTSTYDDEMEGAQEMIDSIIAENLRG